MPLEPGVRVTVIGTNASFGVSVPGYVRDTSNTAASFLVTAKSVSLTNASFLAQVSVPAFVNVKGPTTRGSTVVQADHSLVVSGTAASFLAQVSVPAFVNVKGPTTRGSTVVQADHSLVISTTNASFLAQVSVPAFVNVKGPTTRGSTVVQADHSLVVASNASFSISVPGILRYPTTRGSTVDAVDHSLVVSGTAASFLATVVNVGTARSTWPTAEANNATTSTFITDLSRRLIVSPYTFPEKTQSTTLAVSTTVPIALFGATSGERNYLTSLMGANSSGTNTEVDFFDRTTAGRTFAKAFIASGGGGFSLILPTPIRGNTNSTVVVRVTPTFLSVLVTAVGYSAP